jgi:Armadillo/beta-catenin-like repeat
MTRSSPVLCRPPLIALLAPHFSVPVHECAAGALASLSDSNANQIAIGMAGGIPPLTALLSAPAGDVQKFAAGALRNLSFIGGNAIMIARAGGLPRLIALLALPSSSDVHQSAAIALCHLSMIDPIAKAFAAAGGISHVSSLLQSPVPAIREVAARGALVLAALAATMGSGVATTTARTAIAAAGVAPLVDVLGSNIPTVRANGVRTLALLTSDAASRAALAACGAREPLRALLAVTRDAGVHDSVTAALRALA